MEVRHVNTSSVHGQGQLIMRSTASRSSGSSRVADAGRGGRRTGTYPSPSIVAPGASAPCCAMPRRAVSATSAPP